MSRTHIGSFGLTLGVLLLLSWGLPLLALSGGTWQSGVATLASIGCDSWTISSLLVALGTSLACLVVGAAMLYLIESSPIQSQWRWLAILCVPLAIPPYLLGLAWAPLLSPVGLVVQPVAGGCALPPARSVLSVIVVLTGSYYPIALLALRAVRSAWHVTYDEAASVSGLGNVAQIRLRARWYWPSAAGAFALIALLVLGEFAVADYYGVRTLAAGIFAVFASYQDPRAVTSLLIPLAVAAVVLVVVASAAFRRTQMRLSMSRDAEVSNCAGESRRAVSSARENGAVAALLGFVAVTLVVPMYLLLSSLGTAAIDSLAGVWKVARSDLTTSIWLAAAVSVLTLPLALAIAAASAYARSSWEHLPRVIAWIAFLTPPSLWGLGALVMQSKLPLGTWITGSAMALILGMILRSLALGAEILSAKMIRVPRNYLEAAAVSGLPRWQALRVGVWKPIRTTCWSALVLVWVWVLGDITLTVLVAPPGTSTLMLRIFQSVHYGPAQWLAALTSWHLAMTAAGIAVALLLFRRSSPMSLDRPPHVAVG